MSTIALQHIPVYDIRKSLITDLLRTLKPGGLFSFQLGYGEGLNSPIGPRSSYYDNIYEADNTNSAHDVRVHNKQDVIDDLSKIGYNNITALGGLALGVSSSVTGSNVPVGKTEEIVPRWTSKSIH